MTTTQLKNMYLSSEMMDASQIEEEVNKKVDKETYTEETIITNPGWNSDLSVHQMMSPKPRFVQVLNGFQASGEKPTVVVSFDAPDGIKYIQNGGSTLTNAKYYVKGDSSLHEWTSSSSDGRIYNFYLGKDENGTNLIIGRTLVSLFVSKNGVEWYKFVISDSCTDYDAFTKVSVNSSNNYTLTYNNQLNLFAFGNQGLINKNDGLSYSLLTLKIKDFSKLETWMKSTDDYTTIDDCGFEFKTLGKIGEKTSGCFLAVAAKDNGFVSVVGNKLYEITMTVEQDETYDIDKLSLIEDVDLTGINSDPALLCFLYKNGILMIGDQSRPSQTKFIIGSYNFNTRTFTKTVIEDLQECKASVKGVTYYDGYFYIPLSEHLNGSIKRTKDGINFELIELTDSTTSFRPFTDITGVGFDETDGQMYVGGANAQGKRFVSFKMVTEPVIESKEYNKVICKKDYSSALKEISKIPLLTSGSSTTNIVQVINDIINILK